LVSEPVQPEQVLSAISGPLATKFDRNHPIGKLNRGVVSVAAPELPSRPRASAGAVCANSSPAKGRVERAHKTLQDRLVKELRLAWCASWPTANALPSAFITDYNARFAKLPATKRICTGRCAPKMIWRIPLPGRRSARSLRR
jgi:hypothetical protein